MTPEELRALADAATPGPWVTSGTLVDAGDGYNLIHAIDDAEFRSDADARLIALAPDLARLTADMALAIGNLKTMAEASEEWEAKLTRAHVPVNELAARLADIRETQT